MFYTILTVTLLAALCLGVYVTLHADKRNEDE